MLRGLSHITLAVNDLELSFEFYVSLLGAQPHAQWDQGAYLSIGKLWLCLSVDESSPAEDYTHIAFDINRKDFPVMKQKLAAADVKFWKVNKSEGESVYFLDPDGHKLEIHVGNLQARLNAVKHNPYNGLKLFE